MAVNSNLFRNCTFIAVTLQWTLLDPTNLHTNTKIVRVIEFIFIYKSDVEILYICTIHIGILTLVILNYIMMLFVLIVLSYH